MDLRQLRAFVAVAEELHFTRAAERLQVAQSAVSAQVRALERELGAPLLRRSTRSVAMTTLGAAFLDDARDILSRVDAARSRARRATGAERERLVVGCLGPAPGELLTPALARLAEAEPHADVEVRTFDFAEILPAVRTGRADVAFAYLPYAAAELEELDVLALGAERRVVVVARSHPLASARSLRPADLVGEVFVSHPDEVSQTWRDFWLLTAQLGGHRPPTAARAARTLDDWLHLISSGEGIDTAPALVARYCSWPGLACVPLDDAPAARPALLRRRDCAARLTTCFADVVRELAAPVTRPSAPAAA
ncbi:MAG TPA: LysR family transcriptional regulator [Conexibacter sp.]|nr:LysR family transcriptional regulator [Conexibacter sp.]